MMRSILLALLMLMSAGLTASAQTALDNLIGRYESSRENCTLVGKDPVYGEYLTIERRGPDIVMLSGDHQGEGGSCDVSQTFPSRFFDTQSGLTVQAGCREEESEVAPAQIDLVPLFGGRSLVKRRSSSDWSSQTIYYRCDRQPGYSAALHKATNDPVKVEDVGQGTNWARPFICSYASGGTELSRSGCARQNAGDPEVMVWDNGNVVSVVDRGNGRGLLNARSARVDIRDGGSTVCWIIDRNKESFCREEVD
ncbi:MAG: hypothetical protein AAF141_04530 [Pseudomonadota bacterium]